MCVNVVKRTIDYIYMSSSVTVPTNETMLVHPALSGSSTYIGPYLTLLLYMCVCVCVC